MAECKKSLGAFTASLRRLGARAIVAVATLCAVIAGLFLGDNNAPRAQARPPVPQSPEGSQKFPDCGDVGSPDELWNDVKDASPTKFEKNKVVVWPGNDQSRGYAIHDGVQGGGEYNWLLLATSRQKGIECPTLLQDDAPEYFLDAYNEHAKWLPKDTDWALGIESADHRSRDQLHIHISRLTAEARKDIDREWKQIASDESKWKDSVITVQGRKFRAWNSSTLNHNLFAHLNREIVTPLKNDKVEMWNQTMLVTSCAPNTCSGFIVLNSDKVSPNTKPSGADNIEFLLAKA